MYISVGFFIFTINSIYYLYMKLPHVLLDKLNVRTNQSAFRSLPLPAEGVDFSSNDYLGFARNDQLFEAVHNYLVENNLKSNGATGSRLISGNHDLYEIAEKYISSFHQSEAALIFNSGYDANVGFFSAIPQRNDVILYDELCHASIRDGIQMSHAKSYKFQHNDYEDLAVLLKKLEKYPITNIQNLTYNIPCPTIYIVTESVFSMDGDSPNLELMSQIAEQHNAYLVIDEAHALGVFGNPKATGGEGLVQSQQLQYKVFARIVTFGKGLGCHGAAILGSVDLVSYLVNFARSFIYTTGLSPHSVATIFLAYKELQQTTEIEKLKRNINFFNQQIQLLGLKPLFVYSKSAIHSAIIPGNEKVKKVANELQKKGFHVKPILAPTVPEGQERLRFCLHSYTTEKEIEEVLVELSKLVFE